MENARTVAEELAESAGVTLGDVQSIATYHSEVPVPLYREGLGGVAMAAESVPVSPGQMSISVQVSVVYLIQ
jgi:hypothetical protein